MYIFALDKQEIRNINEVKDSYQFGIQRPSRD